MIPKVEPYPITRVTKDQLPKDMKFIPMNVYFDNMIMQSLHINDAQYDYICKYMTDDEFNLLFAEEEQSFAHKRQVAILVNRYKELEKQSQNNVA